MQVIEPGHLYRIASIGEGAAPQEIRFVRKLPAPGLTGTNCQELIRVLIDRTNYLNAEAPCHESVEIVMHLRSALILFETRAARRKLEKAFCVENIETSPHDGHVAERAFSARATASGESVQ